VCSFANDSFQPQQRNFPQLFQRGQYFLRIVVFQPRVQRL
jgi:hypothetical protein